MSKSTIICADAKEQADSRNAYKKYAKANGTFVRVDHNTVVLKGGGKVEFVVSDGIRGAAIAGGKTRAVFEELTGIPLPNLDDMADEFDDEHLPPEAFAPMVEMFPERIPVKLCSELEANVQRWKIGTCPRCGSLNVTEALEVETALGHAKCGDCGCEYRITR